MTTTRDYHVDTSTIDIKRKVWFTSDTHYNHARIREFEPEARPHETLQWMNEDLIAKYNSKVGQHDVCYHLGDVALGPKTEIPGIVKRLNGYKILILGNHDKSRGFMLDAGFDEVHRELTIKLNDLSIYLRHIPKVDHGHDLMLNGHVHSSWVRNEQYKMENVGVDVCNLFPMSLEELLARRQKIGKLHRPIEGDIDYER